jgi:hypothetical protein
VAEIAPDIFFASISELSAKLRAKEFSCVELTRAFCDRLPDRIRGEADNRHRAAPAFPGHHRAGSTPRGCRVPPKCSVGVMSAEGS